MGECGGGCTVVRVDRRFGSWSSDELRSWMAGMRAELDRRAVEGRLRVYCERSGVLVRGGEVVDERGRRGVL